MRGWDLALALLFVATSAQAGPYFRVIDPAHPKIAAGACADPVNVGNSSQCSLVSVVSHSHNDGFLLFPGEDWSLLGIGYALSGEQKALIGGPSVNLSAVPLDATTWAMQKLYPGSAATLMLETAQKAAALSPLNVSFGPMWMYDPVANHGYFRLFCGAAWQF
jgi:hypothetical protein